MANRGSALQNTVGLDGYCPVCIIEMNKWVRGRPEYQTTYDGKTYYFPGEEQKKMFLADPAKFVPALGGDCTVCFVNKHQRVAGSVKFTSIYKKRLFLFPGADQKRAFAADPEKYAKADLAVDGNCAVCQGEMNQEVAGKPEFAVFHQGLRYLFPSSEQRKMFLANPSKYAIK